MAGKEKQPPRGLAETIEQRIKEGWSKENIVDSLLVEHPECTPQDVLQALRLLRQGKKQRENP